MNPASPTKAAATARWLILFLLLAGGLTASLLGLTRWPGLPAPVVGEHPAYLLDVRPERAPDAGLSWLGNPLEFAQGDVHGFAGAVSRQRPHTEYRVAEWQESPRWLGLDPALRRLGAAPAVAPVKLPEPKLSVPLLPVSLRPAPLARMENAVERSGALAQRRLLQIEAVAPPVGEVLPAVVVEVAVNPWGQVVTTRILTPSGSAATDAAVLRASRAARFEPLPRRLGRPEAVLTELEWGRLTFQWGAAGVPLR